MKRPPPRTHAYECQTRGVTVRVRPAFLASQSDPANGRYLWSYTVEIENHGRDTVQLASRHWIITDALNRVEEVRGQGVVGDQPTLRPGEAYRYSSSCPLKTASGGMRGSYRMVTDAGEAFDAAIPEFSLHMPGATWRVN
ncbi:MAG: Co2+/Mg2+ efflux protein ApaG [Caulobacterales bacterium]